MPMPTVEFSLALGQNWNTEPPTWTNLSTRLKRGGCKRGRSFEFDQSEVGGLNVTLKNQDRALEPDYPGSIYYPNLDPGGTPGRIRVTHAGVTYPLARGVAEDMAPQWELQPRADVPMTFVDAFDSLKEADVTLELAASAAGSQIVAILDAISWPSALRAIDAGISTISAASLTAANALQEINTIGVESELGNVFVDKDGDIVFHDRHRRRKSPYLTPVATFGDGGPGEIPYRDLDPVFDTSRVKNRAVVTRTGGTAQTFQNDTSVTKRGRRTITRAPRLTADAESMAMAEFLVAKFHTPSMRFEKLEWVYRGSDAHWATILALEVSDRVTVLRRPPGGGDPVEKDCHVEAVEHDFAPGNRWRTVLSLSPAALEKWFVLDHPVYGTLDTATNLLGY